MTDLVMRRTLAGLEPTSDDDREHLRYVKPGELVRVKITKPRNLQQHRLYWSLCDLVAENHPEIRTRELASQAIKLLAGHVDLVQVKGQVLKVPRSISFSSMEQGDFEIFFRQAIQVVADELLGSAPETIREELARRLT